MRILFIFKFAIREIFENFKQNMEAFEDFDAVIKNIDESQKEKKIERTCIDG